MLPWLRLVILLFSSCALASKKIEHGVPELGDKELKQKNVAFASIINDLPWEFEPRDCKAWDTDMVALQEEIRKKYIKILESEKLIQNEHAICLRDAFQGEIINSLNKQYIDLQLDFHCSKDTDFNLLTQLRITYEILELITKDNALNRRRQSMLFKGVEKTAINIDIQQLVEQEILEILEKINNFIQEELKRRIEQDLDNQKDVVN